MRNATPAPIVVHPSRSATTTSAAASSSSLSKKRRLWFVACFILLVTSFGMIRWEFSPSTPSTPDHHNLHHHRRGTHPLRTQEGHVVAGKRGGEIAVANSDPPSHVLADVDDEDLVRWLPIDIDSGHHWHDFTPQLPQGATKFCPAFDDASMEVMEPYIPSGDPQEIPNRTVWVDGCREPVMLLPFQGIKMYPQLKCGALKPWRSYAFVAKVIRERFVTAAAEEEEKENRVAHGGGDDSSNQKPAHADDTTTFVSDPIVISPEIGVTTEPPARVVQECLTKCLESPCCLTFTLERSSDFGGDADNSRRRSATFHAAAATAFVCTLQLCDYTTAHHRREPVELFKGYSYVIAHRREYRPSLVRSEWRLAVHRAPGRVLRLTEPQISSFSSVSSAADYWKVHTNNDHIRHNDNNSSGVVLFEVRAVAEHGTRFQPVRGTVRFRVRCFGEIPVNRSVPTSPTRLSIDDDDVTLEKYSSSFLDVASPEVTMFMGSATTDGRWLPPTAVWETCVGRVMRVDVDAIISRIILDEELRTPFPNGEEVLRLHTTLYSLVHRVANRVKLFLAPPRSAPASRFGERTLPPGLFSDSKDTCAPLLREGECCLRHLYASQSWNNHTCHFDYHNPTSLSALPARDKGCLIASSSHPMLERSYVTLVMDEEEEIPSGAQAVNNNNNNTVVVATSVSERQQQRQRPPCVRLVDGYTSHFDEDGVARFPNLVVWVNRRDARCVSDEISVRLNLMPRFEEDPFEGEFRRRQVGGATELLFLKKKKEKDTAAGEDRTGGGRESSQVVPVSWFLASCGNRGTGKSAAAPPPPPPTDAADLSKYKKMEESKEDLQTPILISVPAHECVECLHSFLQNIRAFVWPSVVVIHFPSTIASLPAPSELAALNNSHPLTFINRLRVDSVIGVRLLHIHGLNVHYAMHELPWITFSHALFLASNEMFVKHGTIEYIRRHDAVWMTNPTADAGALFEHHGDGQHHWTVQEFLTMEEMLRYPPKKWGFVWPDAIVADHWLAAAMRRRNLTTHPFNTVLLEGTFFRRDIAGEFANEIMTMFDPFDYCEEPMLYPHCEILGPTVLQNVCSRPGVRCGHRVTTMLWLRDMWTSTVDDVRRVRCSPFEIPFGFKRVPRTMTDPVRIAITRLTHEALLTNDTKTASEPSSVRELGDYCIIPSHEE